MCVNLVESTTTNNNKTYPVAVPTPVDLLAKRAYHTKLSTDNVMNYLRLVLASKNRTYVHTRQTSHLARIFKTTATVVNECKKLVSAEQVVEVDTYEVHYARVSTEEQAGNIFNYAPQFATMKACHDKRMKVCKYFCFTEFASAYKGPPPIQNLLFNTIHSCDFYVTNYDRFSRNYSITQDNVAIMKRNKIVLVVAALNDNHGVDYRFSGHSSELALLALMQGVLPGHFDSAEKSRKGKAVAEYKSENQIPHNKNVPAEFGYVRAEPTATFKWRQFVKDHREQLIIKLICEFAKPGCSSIRANSLIKQVAPAAKYAEVGEFRFGTATAPISRCKTAKDAQWIFNLLHKYGIERANEPKYVGDKAARLGTVTPLCRKTRISADMIAQIIERNAGDDLEDTFNSSAAVAATPKRKFADDDEAPAGKKRRTAEPVVVAAPAPVVRNNRKRRNDDDEDEWTAPESKRRG